LHRSADRIGIAHSKRERKFDSMVGEKRRKVKLWFAPKLETKPASKISVRSHSQEWLFIKNIMYCLAKAEEKIKC
jgi:hypothetical protein